MRFRNCLGMIWSVSTSARSSGAMRPVTYLTGSITDSAPLASARRMETPNYAPLASARRNPAAPLEELPHVDEVARDRGGRRHRGAHQVRAPAGALPSFEV